MSENKVVKGYKVFNPDWTCRGIQYEVGKSYEMEEHPIICEKGFHFCEKLIDCYDYYDFDEKNKVAEVIAYGDIDVEENGKKSCTNKIKIEREIYWYEVIAMVNVGKKCTGLGNSGNNNSGYWNSGNNNSGNNNSGNNNSGYYNSGNNNSGDCNSGNNNSGNNNSGDCNSGNNNSGNNNSGYYNSGNNNSGDYNSGNNNSGYWNSGNNNSGYYNSGYYNSGDWNSGDYNSGDWNATNYSSGCFNTAEQKIFLFNTMSDWTMKDWINSEAKRILSNMEIIPIQKVLSLEEMAERQQYWNELSQEEKEVVMAIPNFDKEIFKEITGIDITM